MSKRAVLLAVVLVMGGAAFVAAWPQPGGFRAWMAEVRDADDDWGWDLLGAEAQGAYGGNRDAYVADMTAADWENLDLGPAVTVRSHDGFIQVEAELRSDPTTVPAFLFERQITHGVCDDGQPIALGVFEDRRPFQLGAFNGAGLTGSQQRCNTAFTDIGE